MYKIAIVALLLSFAGCSLPENVAYIRVRNAQQVFNGYKPVPHTVGCAVFSRTKHGYLCKERYVDSPTHIITDDNIEDVCILTSRGGCKERG